METKFVGFRARTDWFDQLDEVVWQCRTTRSDFIRKSIDHFIDHLSQEDETSCSPLDIDTMGGLENEN